MRNITLFAIFSVLVILEVAVSPVGAVTSFGINGNCAGTGGVYRVDRADDWNWLATFGVTP